MYCVDEAGRITFVNHPLCELLGVDRSEQLVGQDHHQALGHCLPTGEVETEIWNAPTPVDANCALPSATLNRLLVICLSGVVLDSRYRSSSFPVPSQLR